MSKVLQDEEVRILSRMMVPQALEFDGLTEYSHIKIYRRDSMRCLSFVWDDGQEAAQSLVNLARPWVLGLEYLRQMVKIDRRGNVGRVLLIGLGGGNLVHHYLGRWPGSVVDVVELDSGIVEVGRRYFGVGSSPRVRVLCGDACTLVRELPGRYDVAHVDAFLRPQAATHSSGEVQCVVSPEFLGALRQRVRAAAFNCHEQSSVAAIARAFPGSYVLPAPGARVVAAVVG